MYIYMYIYIYIYPCIYIHIYIGWGNGLFNVRRLETGDTVFKEMMGSAVASIVRADYRLDGKEEIMICAESGEVRGYLPGDAELIAMTESGIYIHVCM
jgi:hypothetical protein